MQKKLKYQKGKYLNELFNDVWYDKEVTLLQNLFWFEPTFGVAVVAILYKMMQSPFNICSCASIGDPDVRTSFNKLKLN